LWWLSLTTDPESDYWFWDGVAAFNGLRTKTFSLPVSDAEPADGQLTLRLHGASSTNHLLTISTGNGTSLGQVAFSGDDAYQSAPLTVPASELVDAGQLDIEITAEDSPSGAWSAVLIDGFELTWLRSYRANQGTLSYPADGDTSVFGYNGAELVTLSILDPDSPAWVDGGDVIPQSGGFAYAASLPLGEYITVDASATLKPQSMELDGGANLAAGNLRADYVVITHSELMDAAEALAAYRSAEFQTLVVDIQDVYDSFTHGEPRPQAIKAFAAASQSWKTPPRYFTIMGDGSFDYRDLMGTGYNFVSPQMFGNSNGIYASDTLLGDVDGDGVPELAFGRIPVKSNTEGLAYVDKLIAYEAGIGNLPSLLLSDVPDRGGDFKWSSIQVGEEIGDNIININLQDSSIGEARSQFESELDQGVRLVNYIGHGGIDRVARQGLIVNADASVMDNGVTPGFVGLSCLINNYSIPGFDGLGERLVVEADAGMISSWAATGESFNDQATRLAIEFHSLQGDHERIGDAIIATFQSRPLLVPVYTLIGDAAHRIQ
ncbi:MAG: C25 family cysteine peptidase, partial [Xanthomonadales bacterium]|nr:C25 family cysteine peptidase [Xanthomonadales bacterium]